jgi:hypothetical protein
MGNYQSISAQYEALMKDTLDNNKPENIPRLVELSKQLTAILNAEIEKKSTNIKGDRIDIAQQKLVERLQQIQMDYNGLLTTTDDLETLRRIRQYESQETKTLLYWHLVFLMIVFLVIVLFLIFYRKEVTIAATPMSAPMTPSFE